MKLRIIKENVPVNSDKMIGEINGDNKDKIMSGVKESSRQYYTTDERKRKLKINY